MVKEKLIHWRNVHSPLLYDLARHIDGPPNYWDIRAKVMGEGVTKKERAMAVLKVHNLVEGEFVVVDIDENGDLEGWYGELNSGKWDLSLRVEGFGILISRPKTERKNLVLGGRLRFFN